MECDSKLTPFSIQISVLFAFCSGMIIAVKVRNSNLTAVNIPVALVQEYNKCIPQAAELPATPPA